MANTGLYRSKGTDYLRLRESIRQRGLLEPLVVNRSSRDKDRKLIGGGETRLEILKSLYEETGDSKFNTVECVARKSPRPLRRILSFSVQDDVRTQRFFIERARAILDCVRCAEQENGWDTLSQAEAVSFLRENGLPISPSVYSYMVYAVNKLLPLLPKALYSGWGRPQIERVRSLERTGSKIWEEFGEYGENFEELFKEVVQSCDSDSLLFDDLRYQLEYELYVSCDIELQAVRLLFDVHKSRLDSTVRTLREFDTKPEKSRPAAKIPQPARQRSNTGKRSKRKMQPVYPRSIPVDKRETTYADFNRRRRYARKLALQLAAISNSTRRIRPSDESPIGYSVVQAHGSNSGKVRSSIVLSYINACETIMYMKESKEIKVLPVFSEVSDEEWSYLRDLMEVTRTLKKSLQPISKKEETSQDEDLAKAA
ncbi:MAG: hypothetical protein OXG24_03110 [Gammaproteobacteria bacterium]|nr:hypothetical protein [Gammaproteobacteria bacterium]